MDFGSAFDLNKAAEKAKEQVAKAFSELRSQIETNIREDWNRSKQEAKQLWDHAVPATREAARQMMKATEQLSTDMVTEIKATGQQLRAHLVSPEFEEQLDQWMKSAGLRAKYERFRKMHRASAKTTNAGSDFADVNASVAEDPVETADPFRPATEGLDERRARVREKLAFLYRHHCDEVLEAAKKGAFLGSILGPQTALRFALIAGGLRLGLIFGGVTYTVFIKPDGDWSLDRENI